MLREGQRHRIRTVQFQSGERFTLLYNAHDGLPLPWTTRYSAILRRTRQGSVSTMEQELRAIAVALSWAEDRGINLEERIDGCAFVTPEEALSLRDALRVNLNAGMVVSQFEIQEILPRAIHRMAHNTRAPSAHANGIG